LTIVSTGSASAAPPIRTDANAGATSRMAAFTAAAQELHVPLNVLLATSYNETRWEGHDGKPSFAAGYGPMNLVNLTQADLDTAGWSGDDERQNDLLTAASMHTLAPAAALIDQSVTAVETDSTQNIRAGAALLASYEKQYDHGKLPGNASDWYVAVARYSQSSEPKEAQLFADAVYSTIRSGQSATTQDGQTITEAPQSVHPDRGSVSRLGLTGTVPPANPVMDPPQLPNGKVECPKSLGCTYSPDGYWQYDPNDKGYYGDHDLATRGNTSQGADMQIRYITLHDNEETADGTEWLFHDPTYLASAHYEVNSGTGHVTQLMPVEDVAWDSANPSFYQHSVGIEQEGYAIEGATWYSEAMYRSTATLVKYLATKYHIPLDRQHILGHDNIPGDYEAGIASQHWDPGPYWDWSHFMALLGAPVHQDAPSTSDVVTIDPRFATNKQVVTGCEPIQDLTPFPGPYHGDETCTDATAVPQPKQSVSTVWLHTQPSASSPLAADPYLDTSGTGSIRADDWGDTASTGEQFVVAGHQGDWTAIWYAGQKVWFDNPSGSARTAVPTKARYVITPKPGLASIPIYTTVYPEASAYPAAFVAAYGGVPRTQTARTKYTIPAGQSYVAGGPADDADWYYAANIDGSAPFDQTDFVGTTKYYEITYNHREAFVNAADVDVTSSN
jgi:N-acetyl-anhydromuramyl-L-alanine amidase AmpD